MFNMYANCAWNSKYSWSFDECGGGHYTFSMVIGNLGKYEDWKNGIIKK